MKVTIRKNSDTIVEMEDFVADMENKTKKAIQKAKKVVAKKAVKKGPKFEAIKDGEIRVSKAGKHFMSSKTNGRYILIAGPTHLKLAKENSKYWIIGNKRVFSPTIGKFVN